MIEVCLRAYRHQKQDPLPALEDLRIRLFPGRITTLVGPSGCGKSTFLQILMGVASPFAEGALRTPSGQTFSLDHWRCDQRLFALVPQVPHLLPWKTVLGNVLFALKNQEKTFVSQKKARLRKTLHWLRVVGMQDHVLKYPHQISLGMAQRVSFARSLGLEAQAMLLDEPFASVDAQARRALQIWLRSTVENLQTYALFVTHDIREALFLSHEVHVLSASPATILRTYTHTGGLFQGTEGLRVEEEIFRLLGVSENP